MIEEVFIPKFGQTVEEVMLVSWLVEDGQLVEQGQPVLDVETDKAVFSVEATKKGYIHIGPYEKGDVVPVVTVVAIIGKEDDQFELHDIASSTMTPIPTEGGKATGRQASPERSAARQESERERLFASPRARKVADVHGVNLTEVTASGAGGKRIVERDVALYLSRRPKATPVAQRVAREAGIDLGQITGSGPQGRIVRADVEAVAHQTPLEKRSRQALEASTAESAAAQPLHESDVLERVPLQGIRGIIANRMAESAHTTARVTLLIDVDATAFVALRERLKKYYSDRLGFSPTFNDLFVKIVTASLRQFPYMNARLAQDAIEVLSPINVGMAVNTERGLIVPVLRHADQKSLQQIGIELRSLIQKAREGSILPDEMSGGTFTITNLGMYDITAFTPVINLPEAAILGVGKINPAVMLRNGQVAEYQKLVLSLVFDHRLIDGAQGARFLQHMKDLIEDPALIVAE